MRLHPEGRKRLAKLLLIQEISHRQLADAIGWRSHGMVSHLISGRRAGVEPDAAIAMAKFLGVEVSDLFLTELPGKHRQGKAAVGSATFTTVGTVLIFLELVFLLGLLGVGAR